MAGDGLSDHARLPHAEARGDHEVALGLAVKFVQLGAKVGRSPVEEVGAQAFAARSHGAERQAVRHRDLAHGAQGRGGQEGDRDTLVPHHGKRRLGVELAHPLRDEREAVVEGRERQVHQPADPRPVGRGPADVTRRRTREDHLDSGQVPGKEAVTVKSALGRAGGAGGVDHHGGIVGADGHGRRRLRRGQRVGERADGDGAVVARGAGRDDRAKVGLRDHGHQLVEVGVVGHREPRARIGEADFKRVLAEEREERQHHRAQFHHREMGDHDPGRLRQQKGDAVAPPDTVCREDRGEAVGGVFQPPEGPDLARAALRKVDDGRTVGVVGGPPIAAGLRDREIGGQVPGEVGAGGGVVARRQDVHVRRHRLRGSAGRSAGCRARAAPPATRGSPHRQRAAEARPRHRRRSRC